MNTQVAVNQYSHLTGNQQRALATRKHRAERNAAAKQVVAEQLERMKGMAKARKSVNW